MDHKAGCGAHGPRLRRVSHHLRCSATSTEPVAAPPKPPERVPIGDTARVAAALAAGGAVILTDLGPIDDWEQTATTLPARVFPQPGKLISTEPVVAGIHRENRRFTELRKERQRAMHAVSPMEQRAIGLNGDEDEPAWGGLGGLTHENNAAAGEDEGGGEAPDINEGGVGGSMLPHTDGYIYGEFYPDMLFLLMEAQAAGDGNEGASFVVDGERVLRRVAEDEHTSHFAPLLESVPVDLSERSPPGLIDGREHFGPLMQRKQTKAGSGTASGAGRLMWKRQIRQRIYRDVSVNAAGLMPYQSLWATVNGNGQQQEVQGQGQGREVQEQEQEQEHMLEAVDSAIQREEAVAARFRVEAGEALLIDNYRMLHGREAFDNDARERKLWRVWCWTDESNGLPQGMAVLATPFDVAKILEHEGEGTKE